MCSSHDPDLIRNIVVCSIIADVLNIFPLFCTKFRLQGHRKTFPQWNFVGKKRSILKNSTDHRSPRMSIYRKWNELIQARKGTNLCVV